MTCGICANNIFFFIGKLYSIDNHETTNVFNILDYLLANTNYTARQTEKH